MLFRYPRKITIKARLRKVPRDLVVMIAKRKRAVIIPRKILLALPLSLPDSNLPKVKERGMRRKEAKIFWLGKVEKGGAKLEVKNSTRP